ncbi:MAG: hypothetical protein AAFV95_17995 [Bacteroidota bacterium]
MTKTSSKQRCPSDVLAVLMHAIALLFLPRTRAGRWMVQALEPSSLLDFLVWLWENF